MERKGRGNPVKCSSTSATATSSYPFRDGSGSGTSRTGQPSQHLQPLPVPQEEVPNVGGIPLHAAHAYNNSAVQLHTIPAELVEGNGEPSHPHVHAQQQPQYPDDSQIMDASCHHADTNTTTRNNNNNNNNDDRSSTQNQTQNSSSGSQNQNGHILDASVAVVVTSERVDALDPSSTMGFMSDGVHHPSTNSQQDQELQNRQEEERKEEAVLVQAHHAGLTDFMQNRNVQLLLGGILCLAVTLAVVVAVIVVLSANQDQQSISSKTNITNTTPAPTPTVGSTMTIIDTDSSLNRSSTAPTLSPSLDSTHVPTGMPSVAPLVVQDLPDFTLAAMEDRLSPQALSYKWLQDHPLLESMETWRKQQVFALVSIYYALNGPESWTAAQNRSYLSYDIDECEWGPTESSLSTTTGNTGIICDPIGRIQELYLVDIDGDTIKSHRQGFLPPEIGLLTSLKVFEINDCDLKRYMFEEFFLPDQLGKLTELQSLQYRSLKLKGGTIPSLSPLSQLTNLRLLSLFSSSISGTLQTEIGQLSHAPLQFLDLSWNLFSGTIPSEVGMLTNLTTLRLYSTNVDGQVPSEIALLTSLQTLELRQTSLAGGLPDSLCSNLPSLRRYGLGIDCRTGGMPCPTSCADVGEKCNCG